MQRLSRAFSGGLRMLVLLFLVLPPVGGCARLGPDYQTPDIGVDTPPVYQQEHAAGPAVEGDAWWTVFGDPDVNRIVSDVLKNNWDIRKAAARVLEARSVFVQTRAERYPAVSWRGSAARQSFTSEITMPTFNVSPGGVLLPGEPAVSSVSAEIDQFNLSFPVTFELDLWGRLARAEEASRADLLQAEEARRTVAQSLVSEALTEYFRMESLERRIQVLRESVGNYRRSVQLVQFRYERGLADVVPLLQTQRVLAQTEAGLPVLLQELGSSQQRLAVLMGRYPETAAPRQKPGSYYKRLAPVPPGLPSDLLLRRPDVRAAEATLKSLNARVGVAEASRFPAISLTGSLGYASDELSSLFQPESQLWNIAINIAGPVFNAGKLKSAQKAAEARYQQGVAEYAKTVLKAFSEVEGALLSRTEQLKRRDMVVKWLEQAVNAQAAAENRYERGLTGYLDVLESQRARYAAEETLVLTDFAIFTNRVSLHRALGGGWGETPVERAAE